MATLTVTATVDSGTTPQRVRVDVVDAGTPAINAATVTRTDQFGNTQTVRTQDGLPLVLVASGGGRAGVVWDYEAPYGVPVTYSTVQQPAATSAAVTVNESRVWLIHPGVPSRSMPIDLMRGSLDAEQEDVAAGVFFPMGRREAVAVSDGRRKAPSSELIVGTETLSELAQLRELLADVFPLLLNVPPSLGLGVDTAYVHVGALRRARRSDIGSAQARNWSLPIQVVATPIGGAQAEWTWQDVMDAAPTWQDVLNRFGTWAQVQAPSS